MGLHFKLLVLITIVTVSIVQVLKVYLISQLGL